MSKKIKKTTIERACAEIRGVRYILAPRTLPIQERIDKMAKMSMDLGTNKMSVSDFYTSLISFVELTTKCRDFKNSDLKSGRIDLTELELAVINILDGYSKQRDTNRELLKTLFKEGAGVVQKAD